MRVIEPHGDAARYRHEVRWRLLAGFVVFMAFAVPAFVVLGEVGELFHWRNVNRLRALRTAEGLAASIASQELASGQVLTSLDQLVAPHCAGLHYCFDSQAAAQKYALENEARIGVSDGGRIVCFKDTCAPIGLGECNGEPCRTCSMLKSFDEACGAQLIAQCGPDAGHQFFTGFAPEVSRPMFRREIHCDDGLVALTDGGTVPPGPVRHVTVSTNFDGYSFRIGLGSCGACEGAVRPTASGWVPVAP